MSVHADSAKLLKYERANTWLDGLMTLFTKRDMKCRAEFKEPPTHTSHQQPAAFVVSRLRFSPSLTDVSLLLLSRHRQTYGRTHIGDRQHRDGQEIRLFITHFVYWAATWADKMCIHSFSHYGLSLPLSLHVFFRCLTVIIIKNECHGIKARSHGRCENDFFPNKVMLGGREPIRPSALWVLGPQASPKNRFHNGRGFMLYDPLTRIYHLRSH